MKDTIKAIGGAVMTLVGFILFGLVVYSLIFSGTWLFEKIMPLLEIVEIMCLLFAVFILLPLMIVKKTRIFSCSALYLLSYVFGLYLWIYGFLITLSLWGTTAVIIGIFIAGVGVVPFAIIASIINGSWVVVGNLLFFIFLTFGSRILGMTILEREEQKTDNMYYEA